MEHPVGEHVSALHPTALLIVTVAYRYTNLLRADDRFVFRIRRIESGHRVARCPEYPADRIVSRL